MRTDRRLIHLAFVCLLITAAACGAKTPLSPGSNASLPLVAETSHYEFHYAAGDAVDTEWQESYHAWAAARLGVQPGRKIGYFKYRSRQEMGQYTGDYNTNGYADPERMEIHTLWPTDNHEVVHLLMTGFGRPAALFSEGVAVAFQTDPAKGDFDSRFNGEEVHHAARRYLQSGELVLPLDRIVETAGFRAVSDATLAYREAGSFVRFLIDSYGLARFLSFYKSGLSPGDTKQYIKMRFRESMGFSFEEAEAAWLDALRAPS